MCSGPEFEALVMAMKQSPRPMALLGAGTSVDSGFPDWNTLLERLEEKATTIGKEKLSPKYKVFIRTLNDPAWQAEEYRRIIGEHGFKSLIANLFSYKGRVGTLLQAVVKLKFRHILTTNYDSCIEEAYQLYGSSINPIDWNEDTKIRDFFLNLSRPEISPTLVYLHGRYYEPDKIILTESSYATRYVKSDDAQRKLFAIFITQPVVFIGFSINDPDLNHIMREVNARLGIGNPQHFAMMGFEVEEQRQLIKSRFEGKFGIRPIFYKVTRNSDGTENHGELLSCLKQLYERVYEEKLEIVSSPKPQKGPQEQLQEQKLSPSIDPLDQQKGKWGGKSENNNRRIRVEKIWENEEVGLCSFELVVEPITNVQPQFKGEVNFHLHQTFDPDKYTIPVKKGKAVLDDMLAYGAFTVGVETDNGQTKLELDLSKVEEFPKWFRES